MTPHRARHPGAPQAKHSDKRTGDSPNDVERGTDIAINGRHLTRTQVFEWNEAWSYTDRAKITAALGAVPNRMCVIPPSDGYIGVSINGEEADHRALIIYPGYLVWPGDRWTKDILPEVFPEMECEGCGHRRRRAVTRLADSANNADSNIAGYW